MAMESGMVTADGGMVMGERRDDHGGRQHGKMIRPE